MIAAGLDADGPEPAPRLETFAARRVPRSDGEADPPTPTEMVLMAAAEVSESDERRERVRAAALAAYYARRGQT